MSIFSRSAEQPPASWFDLGATGSATQSAFGRSRPEAGSQLGGVSTAGAILTIGGAVTSAIGAFAAIQDQKHALKAQKLSFEFEAMQAAINARGAEKFAQQLLQAGRTEIGQMQLQFAAEKAARRTSAAGRGIVTGSGSSAEELASVELASKMNAFQMNLNTVQRANAAREQGAGFQGRGLIASASARNAGRSARSLLPGAAASASLLSSAGSIANQWVATQRSDLFYGRGL